MASLHILHMSCLCFLLLESLVILVTSRPRDQDRLLTSVLLSSPAVCLLLLGLAPGLLYTLVTIIILQPQLMTSDGLSLCWLDVTSPSLAALFLAPTSLLAVSAVCVLAGSGSSGDPGRSVTSVRPCVLLLTVLEASLCVLGPAASTLATAHPAVVISYQGVRAGLALGVILRTLLDEQVRLDLNKLASFKGICSLQIFCL